MEKKISIIIPCYNAAACLSRPMDSIREQDYKNLEIILVNDGSTDSTLDVANLYAALDPRVSVISQANGGVSVARNNGLNRATGEYIMFLDADDNYTTPTTISTMMNRLLETDADMCICNFTHPCFEQYLGDGVYDLTNKEQFFRFYQDFFAHGMPWNKLQKRECLTEQFVPGITFNEDELYNMDNMHNLKKVVIVDQVLHNYYCTPYIPKVGEGASAVNSIYTTPKFWDQKCTIWYMGMKNDGYRVSSISKWHPDMFDDIRYIRPFDFFFFDILMQFKNNVKEEYIVKSCKNIFAEQLFIDSLLAKENYGITLKNGYFNISNIKKFIKLSYMAYKSIKRYNKKLSLMKILSALFGKMFYTLTKNINTIELTAASFVALEANSTPEAMFVNSLMKKQEMLDKIFADYLSIFAVKDTSSERERKTVKAG